MSAAETDVHTNLRQDVAGAIAGCERALTRVDAAARPRSAQIDFMRAVAVVAVVLIHVWGPGTEVTPERGPLHAALFAAFVSGSVFAVPLFFLASGYVLTAGATPETWGGRRRWWRRRATRLLPPYLFWSALSLIAFGPHEAGAALMRILSGSASYQMYFVVALFQAYLLWSLVMPWLWRQPVRTQSLILLSAVAVTPLVHGLRALQLSAAEVDTLPFLRATLLPWVGYFALGVWLALRSAEKSSSRAVEKPGTGGISRVDPGPRAIPGRNAACPCVSQLPHSHRFPKTSWEIGGCRSPSRRRLALWLGTAAVVSLSLMVLYRVTYAGPHAEDPFGTLLKPLYAVSMIGLLALLGGYWEGRASQGARRFIAALAGDAYGIYLCHVLVIWALSPVVHTLVPGLGLGTEVAYRSLSLLVTVGLSWGIVRVLSLVPGVRQLAGSV